MQCACLPAQTASNEFTELCHLLKCKACPLFKSCYFLLYVYFLPLQALALTSFIWQWEKLIDTDLTYIILLYEKLCLLWCFHKMPIENLQFFSFFAQT